MNFPKRYLTDGTATTRRVVSVEPTDTAGEYRVLTAWAGNHAPEDQGWRATVADGSVKLSGLPERETPQTRAGIVRRVRGIEARSAH
jgi:hypothetical protein